MQKLLLNLSSLAIMVLLLCSCGKPSPDKIAKSSGFKQVYIQTSPFKLATFQKIQSQDAPINIYIEGDGRAWITRNKLSNDPTPKSATALQLASMDPNPNVIYLARPCQYSPEDLKTVCEAKYWSQARYSNTVVTSMSQAISKLKILSRNKKINLIGYSGGGTLAMLIAARRSDIASIRTIAGNLDLKAMDEYHDSTPLHESLDPMHIANQVRHIPQLHFVGAKDDVVPEFVVRNFQRRARLHPHQVISLKGVDHANGWKERWPELLKHIP